MKSVCLIDYVDDYGDYDCRCRNKDCKGANDYHNRFTTHSEPKWCPYCGVEFDKVVYRENKERPYPKTKFDKQVGFDYEAWVGGEKQSDWMSSISRNEVLSHMKRRQEMLEVCEEETVIKLKLRK